jgi:hypothetical protein
MLGAAVVAIGVCFTLTADARPAPADAPAAPLAARLREANDSLELLKHPDMDSAPHPEAGGMPDEKPGIQWGNYWRNFNPWQNWNNWNNWHNFNQWNNV